MSGSQKLLSVSRAATLCGVGRTTVGYWIRSKKLHATRTGRNYSIAVEDLLYFLKTSGQKIPSGLLEYDCCRPIFKSFQNCWQYWNGSEHGRKCQDCIAFRNQLEACFTIKDSGLLGCSECSDCQYYIDTYLHRIQFVHQIDMPAAVFKGLYLWGGNSQCAEICSVQMKDLVGMGIERIVHADSLPKVIESLRKLALGKPETKEDCSIWVKNYRQRSIKIRVSVYPLSEPGTAFLALGMPLNSDSIYETSGS
jgi:excisionase family DNA binding protein